MENIMNLVKVERNANYGLVVSSRVIAKALDKRHDNILRDIDAIIENQSAEISVNPISSNVRKLIFHNNYKDSRNRNYREYLLTKDGFILYMFNIQGHNGFKMAYINEFNRMEKELEQIKYKPVPTSMGKVLIPLDKIRYWERLKKMQQGISESGIKLFEETKKLDEAIKNLQNIEKELLGYIQVMNYDISELEN